MKNRTIPSRITDLDCLRGLAIIMVVFYHFFSRWDNFQLYSSNQIGEFFIFKFGYLGVELFFIISGFVIFLTLERSKNYLIFMRNRLIRLLPLLILCSLITFLIIKLIPNIYFKPTSLDFLPSLTFVDPIFWRLLLKNSNINFIDGVYWSLLVEMKFYLLVGAMYFLLKERFMVSWLLVNTFILVISLVGLLLQIMNTDLFQVFRLISFSEFFSYFSFGMIFYLIYNNKPISFIQKILIGVIFVLHSIVYLNLPEIIFLVISLVLFSLFVKRSKIFKIFSNDFFLFLGGISYPLYLLHQNIGVLMIGRINNALDGNTIIQYVIPFLIFCTISLLAWFMHNHVDVIIQKKIKQYVKTKKAS